MALRSVATCERGSEWGEQHVHDGFAQRPFTIGRQDVEHAQHRAILEEFVTLLRSVNKRRMEPETRRARHEQTHAPRPAQRHVCGRAKPA